jgi:hypothetical protein
MQRGLIENGIAGCAGDITAVTAPSSDKLTTTRPGFEALFDGSADKTRGQVRRESTHARQSPGVACLAGDMASLFPGLARQQRAFDRRISAPAPQFLPPQGFAACG